MTYSLDELVDKGLEHAKHVLIGVKGAQIVPFFHIQFINGGPPPVVMVTPFRDDKEKRLVIASVRATLKEFRPLVDSYSFVTEAWVANQSGPVRSTDLSPSEREDRRECVIITAANKDEGVMRCFEIKRSPDATVCELVPETDKHDRVSGPLFNLFDDE